MTVRALVLCAGLGTRLRPLTYVRAKAAVPVNGETLARRAIAWLAGQGCRDLVVNLHHRPESLAASIGDGGDLGVRVRYSWENPVLGSAGGPRHALPLLTDGGASRFLLVNGDTLTDVDLAALLASHDRSGGAVTMALIPNPRPDKYGGVRVSDDGWVTGFTRAGSPGRSFHFVGVQAAEARAFAALDDNMPAESVNALYPALMARDPHAIGAFVCAASFHDIGTPADYLHTSLELAAREGDRMASGRRCHIADSARLTRTAVWDDVVVGSDAVLDECIVCDGVRIPDGARYARAAIAPAGATPLGPGERVDGGLLIKSI